MISRDKVEKIRILSSEFSRHELAEKFGVEVDTIRRYLSYSKEPVEPPRAPKILILDIETMYMKVGVWYLGKQYIPAEHIHEEWNVLSWAAKWLFDDEVMSDILTPEESKTRNDRRILHSVWELIEDASVIIGHNLQNFDMRKLNARFVTHDMRPPLPYQIIDTLKVAKRNFALPAYSLDYLCKLFGLTPKIKTEGGLWDRCLLGDMEALVKMETYNKQDVESTEELYIRLLPWVKSHPNINLFLDCKEPLCPNCGSSDLDWKGNYYTPAGRFETFRCSKCGAIGRSRYSELGKEQRKNLTVPVAR